MKRIYNGFTILMASLCLLFFVVFSVSATEGETVKLIVKNEGPAPKFEYLDDINATRSPDYSKARLTAVHFWATWCAPCIDEMPAVDDTQEIFRNTKMFGSDDFQVIPIAIDGRNMAKVKRFFYNQKIKHLPAYIDPTQDMPKRAKLAGLPGTLFVNSKGEVVARANGPLDWQGEEVQKLLKSYATK